MDEAFTCPAEDGGGYFSSRARHREETKGDEGEGTEGISGSLPLRLRVRKFLHVIGE